MKSIVITGSTRGIGLEMAKVFLSSGCNVTISGRVESLSHQAEDDLLQNLPTVILPQYISIRISKKYLIFRQINRKQSLHI